MSDVVRIVLTRTTATVLREMARKHLSVPCIGPLDPETNAMGALYLTLDAQLEETTSRDDVTTSKETTNAP